MAEHNRIAESEADLARVSNDAHRLAELLREFRLKQGFGMRQFAEYMEIIPSDYIDLHYRAIGDHFDG